MTTVSHPVTPQVATDMGDGLEFVDFGADYTGRAVDISSGPCALFDDGIVKWCVLFPKQAAAAAAAAAAVVCGR